MTSDPTFGSHDRAPTGTLIHDFSDSQRPADRSHLLLRLNFQVGSGDTPTLMLASSIRFCADGALRGPDNCIVARCVDGLWQVGGRAHRELECEGPVRVRITARRGEQPVHHGPFQQLRTLNGVLYADGVSLDARMPTRTGTDDCHEIAFLP